MLAAVCSSALACCSVREGQIVVAFGRSRRWPLPPTRSLCARWRQHRTAYAHGLRGMQKQGRFVRLGLGLWVRSPFAIPSAERTAKAKGLVINRVIQKPRLAQTTAIRTTTKAATSVELWALLAVGTGTVLEHGIKRLEQRARATTVPRSGFRVSASWDRWTGPAAWCSRSGSGPGSSGTPPTAVLFVGTDESLVLGADIEHLGLGGFDDVPLPVT